MAKPVKPNIAIPQEFAKEGQKTDFTEDKVLKGFDPVDPDVLAGDNLNKFIDDTYKGINYSIKCVDDLYNGAVLYDENITYNNQSIVFNITEDNTVEIYKSLVNDNINNPLSDTTKWIKVEISGGGSGLEICDIGLALYVDETQGKRRILNGSVVDINTNSQAWLHRLLKIKTTNPDYFTTETNWQAEKAMNVDGCVYKFVLNYDSTGTNIESVRLPKYPDYVEIDSNSINNSAPVAVHGNGMGLGIYTADTQMGVLQNYSVGGDDRGIQGWYTNNNPPNIVPMGLNSEGYGYIRYATNNRTFGVHTNPAYSGLTGTATITSDFKSTKLKLYYFIQISTGQETEVNITNEIELNNPFFFGMSQYFDVIPNNLSWLKSAGQWNSKAVYPDYYDWILENVNSGSANFKGQIGYGYIDTASTGYWWWTSTTSPHVGSTVYRFVNEHMEIGGSITSLTGDGFTFTDKENVTYTVTRDATKDTNITQPTNWITDYDYVINTSDETFRLPLLDGSEDLPSDKYNDLELKTSGSEYTAPANGFVFVDIQSTTTTGWGSIYIQKNNEKIYGESLDISRQTGRFANLISVERGVQYQVSYDGATFQQHRFIYAKGNGSLYFYVGETVQNSHLVNVARIEEKLVDLNSPSRGYLVESYRNGASWYRVYSDGWCEQGGRTVNDGIYGILQITFLKPFVDTTYYFNNLILDIGKNSGWFTSTNTVAHCAATDVGGTIAERTTTGCYVQKFSPQVWYACGYIS